MKSFEILKQEYFQILSKFDEAFLNEKHPNSKKSEGLSSLFLASEPDDYWCRNKRVDNKVN